MSPAPDLEAPVLVAAFEGWNDAGSAATDAVRFLNHALDAHEIGVVAAASHVDYQANRPQAEIVGGVLRTIKWPVTRVSMGESAPALTVLGTEPSFAWRDYCDHIADTALVHNVGLVVTLGALLGDTPHGRAMTVTGTATDDGVVARLGLRPSRYEGPTGIVGALHDTCRQAGLPSTSLWVAVPHYAPSAPSPKATLALLDRLNTLTELDLDLSRLQVASSAWERQVDTIVASDPQMSAYVRSIEARYDEPDDRSSGSGTEAPVDEGDLPSGEAIAADIEQFLRREDDD